MGAQGLGSRAIIGRFFAVLQQYMGSSWIDKLSMYFASDQAAEIYKWLGMAPSMREWVGGRNAKGFRENGMTIENKDFEATLEVMVAEMRRDKTGQVMIRVAEMARRCGGHWAKLLSTLIKNGTGATSGLCYDGQYFFDDDHSEGASGTQKNLLTASEIPALDVTTATVPTAIEAARAILGVIAWMTTIKDDQGEPANEGARKFMVQTSPLMWQYLAPSVYSNKVNGGESNPVKDILANSDFEIEVIANPYLTYTTQFATFRTDAETKAFIRQEEVELQVKAIAEGSELEFNENKHHYGVSATRNVGFGMWQHAALATFS